MTVRRNDRRVVPFDSIRPAKTEQVLNFPEDFGLRREITITAHTDFSLYAADSTKGDVDYRLLRYAREFNDIRQYNASPVGSGVLFTFAEIAAGRAGRYNPTKTLTVGPFDVFELTNHLDIDVLGLVLEFETLRVRVESEPDTRLLLREEHAAIIRNCKRD